MQISGASSPLILTVVSNRFVGDGNSKKGLLANILLVVIGSILLTISAKVQVPFYPVPMTMQTLLVLLIGMTYGAFLASVTIFLYIFQGALGLPVFANGGGFGYIIGPTGGYIVGFIISAPLLGFLANRGWGKTWQTTAIAMIIGVSVIFFCGVGWLSIYIGFEAAILKGLLPFIYADCLKIVVACLAMPTAWSFVEKTLT